MRDIILTREQENHVNDLNNIKTNVVQPVISKCKKLVGKFKHSESLNRLLKQYQNEHKLEFKIKLVQDVPTRWNSSFDMLDSILVNKSALVAICASPENSDYKVLKDLICVCVPWKISYKI